MKGFVFTELTELAERKFGEDAMDNVFDNVELSSGGAYTSIGYYAAEELNTLVVELAKRQSICPQVLVHGFGEHLFSQFERQFPRFFTDIDNAFDFLAQVDGVIHVEVRKLYPDAELPRFESSIEGDRMVIDYFSPRGLADLASGLIDACIAYYGGGIAVKREDLAPAPAAHSRFELIRQRPT